MRLHRYSSLYSPGTRLVQRMTPRAQRAINWLEGTLMLMLATSIVLYVQL